MNSLGNLRMTFKFLLLLTVSGCSAVSSQNQGNDRTPVRILDRMEIVEGIWRINEEVVLEMTQWFENPRPIDTATDPTLQDFSAAIEFFEKTTGIVSHTGSIFGRVPNALTRHIMAKWNAWFEENKHTLVLTPSSCIGTAPAAEDDKEAQEAEPQ